MVWPRSTNQRRPSSRLTGNNKATPRFNLFLLWQEFVLYLFPNLRKNHKRLQYQPLFQERPLLVVGLAVVSAIVVASLVFSLLVFIFTPNSNEQLSQAEDLMHEGKTAFASTLLEKLVAKDSNHYVAHIRLGQCYLQLNEVAKAENEFRLAMALRYARSVGANVDADDVLGNIAQAKLRTLQGHLVDAEAQLMHTYERFPEQSDVKQALWELYTTWGESLLKQKNYRSSLEKLSLSIDYLNNFDEESTSRTLMDTTLTQWLDTLQAKQAPLTEWEGVFTFSQKHHYSYKTLARLADIYKQHHQLEKAFALYRQAYLLQPDELSLKYGLFLNDLLAEAEATDSHVKLAPHLREQALQQQRWLQKNVKPAKKAGLQKESTGQANRYLHATHIHVNTTAIDPKSLELQPNISFNLQNRSAYTLDYVRLFVVIKNKQQVTLYSKQYTLPYPLEAQGRTGDVRTVVLESERPLPLLRLPEGQGMVEIWVTLNNDASVTWTPLYKQSHTLFNPDQWLHRNDAGYPWQQTPPPSTPTATG